MNDEGQFAFDTLTNSVKDDIDAFLDKFNSYLEIKPDNPDTTEYDPVLDEHPLKYYFASILKKFYNFELFNPHSGVYKNKNMQNDMRKGGIARTDETRSLCYLIT